MSRIIEANVDAIPGPTHLFSGLGVGNLASKEHSQAPSHPKQAALESLQKAELVASLGVPQFVWVPPMRPNSDFLLKCGFGGSIPDQVRSALTQSPMLLQAALSSAFMWAANSGTYSPSVDCADGKSHFTPANLISSLHRSCEASERATDIAGLFQGHEPSLKIHPALPSVVPMRDEGAANHMRLCNANGDRAINVFVYGVDDSVDGSAPRPSFYPRQTLASVEAIARSHKLLPTATAFVQQHPDAISAGAFHNDVIATSHQNVLVYHEKAFAAGDTVDRLRSLFKEQVGQSLKCFKVAESELSLADAVASYLFNSQIVTPDSETAKMELISPKQCESNLQARAVIERLVSSPDCPIEKVHFVSLDQSMAGGGGPACVRLRLPMAANSVALAQGNANRLTSELAERLRAAIQAHYPDQITLADFADPTLLEQTAAAHKALRAVVCRTN